MGTLFFLIIFPIVVAVALLVLKTDAARKWIVTLSSAMIAIGSIYLAVQYFSSGGQYFEFESEAVSTAMMVIEILLALLIITLGLKHKKYVVLVLTAIQAPLMVWFELNVGHEIPVANNLYLDRLSLVMVLIIGIIGTLICVYSIAYMKDFQHHHHKEPDRRPFFFFLMFVFLSAMFGIVTSNNLIWMYFFWEITSLCSFLLIGYTRTPEAIRNSFRALAMNLGGGLTFAMAIVFMGLYYNTVELNQLLNIGMMGYNIVIPVTLLAFAGITKSAQMPFSSWLLGAMIAPTPTSALLHSSTMVKAGVFLIVKLAPVMGWNVAGVMTMMVGGVTFLIASFMAISQSNAKKVLAYSTVANLGLIVACGGIGSPGAVWAAIMLIIFHAVAKSLLFLCVGTAEHHIGSRDIEDMDGLFTKMPRIAQFMSIGIIGMFLAPFGMLLSKWVALRAFVDSGNPLLVLLLVFGSAATLFFWTKWLGKIIAIVAKQESIEESVQKEEWSVLSTLAGLTVALCVVFPVISHTMVVPYLSAIYQDDGTSALAASNMYIMSILAVTIVLMFLFSFGKTKRRIVPIYLSGANLGDDLTFMSSLGQPQAYSLKNWYMERYFGERKMSIIGVLSCSTIIAIAFILLLGGVL